MIPFEGTCRCAPPADCPGTLRETRSVEDGSIAEQIGEEAPRSSPNALQGLSGTRALIGLDGFVDEIIDVVDKCYSPERYDPVRTIGDFGAKISHASCASSNYELVVKRRKLGGNGPIMANALASIGLDVTYIGNLGFPNLHPVFEEFARRAKVISIAEPGHTDALEFDDGKIMLGKHESLNDVNWENLVARVGREPLQQLVDGADLIGLVNWTMLPQMSRIWSKMLEEVFTAGSATGEHCSSTWPTPRSARPTTSARPSACSRGFRSTST